MLPIEGVMLVVAPAALGAKKEGRCYRGSAPRYGVVEKSCV